LYFLIFALIKIIYFLVRLRKQSRIFIRRSSSTLQQQEKGIEEADFEELKE
jgi:hypothetical protein